ncbi:MAG TPA: ABC transporter ATP-binding protein [Pyrinomonadaceae bacterium]
MIEVSEISKTFTSSSRQVNALDRISFSVPGRDFVSIIGPSGCGKSTLLKIIGDIIEPSFGSITVDGVPSREARLKGMFSFVFQNPVLLPWRTVIDNVRLPLEILHRNGRDASALLDLVGLHGLEHQYPSELSGGMQHRVALARALTFDPRILLMDEPFSAVDEFTRDILNVELLRIWQEIGVTIFFITHSISEAVFLSDRVLLLSGRPARVKQFRSIPFARPRDNSLKDSQEFQEVVKCLREDLG